MLVPLSLREKGGFQVRPYTLPLVLMLVVLPSLPAEEPLSLIQWNPRCDILLDISVNLRPLICFGVLPSSSILSPLYLCELSTSTKLGSSSSRIYLIFEKLSCRLYLYIRKWGFNPPFDMPDNMVVRASHVACLATGYILQSNVPQDCSSKVPMYLNI